MERRRSRLLYKAISIAYHRPFPPIARQGLAAAGGSPEKLAEMVSAELARWTRVVAEAKIRRD